MNELIKKLTSESGYYLYDLTETHGIKTVETDNKDEWITLEKFAELIVRECAEFIAPMGDYCGGHGEPSAPSSRECARRLKQHFGVEE